MISAYLALFSVAAASAASQDVSDVVGVIIIITITITIIIIVTIIINFIFLIIFRPLAQSRRLDNYASCLGFVASEWRAAVKI